jgi:PII-like signaling protein
VNHDCLKLTTYFGERDRAHGTFLADALIDLYAREAFQTSVLLRGVEGFGLKHHLHTASQLTLSEDLPLVSVAVDRRERIEAALDEVAAMTDHGLVTLERARMLTGSAARVQPPPEGHEASKLTVYVGRQERAGGGLAFRAAVDLLHRCGVEGATVLFGVDGTAQGVRQRARFFGANRGVPLMIIAVGSTPRIAAAAEQLGSMLVQPLITLERVRICKRDGRLLAEPDHQPTTDERGRGLWQKLMVLCGEQSRHHGRPLYRELVRRLREAGAAGTTALRGVWGYHGGHDPHGDRLLALRRRVPVVAVIVDTPERTRQWFSIVDELTDETGLVTSELVPAFHARTDGAERGGLRLADTSG